MARKAYLDWLRGLAVIIMVEAHVVDAWTRDGDRQGWAYFCAVFLAGMAAPLFLFLAGVSLAMAASARAVTVGHAAAAAAERWRGAQVFLLAFVFRLQSQLLGWGALINFLKVDILNVMGLAMLAAGGMWGLTASRRIRIALFAVATVAVSMGTPLIREAAWPSVLPDPVEWYLRPAPGRTTFTLLPWAGFLLAGVIVGELVDGARSARQDRWLQAGLVACGAGGVALGYAASLMPSIYTASNFWTSSPTFFLIRLGMAALLVPVAWACASAIPAAPVVQALGRSSLFVYWIHVEMVYGILGRPLRRALPLTGSIMAALILCVLLYFIVRWKNRMMTGVTLSGPSRVLAPVLK